MDISILNEAIEKIIKYSFSRSSGPGGQNVNKLNTRVTAKIRISEIDILSEDEKALVREKCKRRINEDDMLTIHVQDERMQGQNREIALDRITGIIAKALAKRKKRVPTKPKPAAKRQRLESKKKHSSLKKQRQTGESE